MEISNSKGNTIIINGEVIDVLYTNINKYFSVRIEHIPVEEPINVTGFSEVLFSENRIFVKLKK